MKKSQFMMTLLLVLGLLFWGWSTDVLWLGITLSLLLFAAFLFRKKYEFDVKSFYQIANLCVLIAASILVYYWLDTRFSKAILPTLRLLPLALMPILLFQILHRSQNIPAITFLFFMREKILAKIWLDISPVFLFACLFSAGAVVHQDLIYFTAVSVLLLILLLILYHQRSMVTQVWVVLMFLSAEAIGVGAMYGINQLQQNLESKMNAWILDYHHDSKSSTAMGEVGRLKLSDSIVFRVKMEKPETKPMLWLERTYQRYNQGEWYGGSWEDQEVGLQDEVWLLATQPMPSHKQATVYQSFNEDVQTLALPKSAAAIKHLPAQGLTIKQGNRIEIQGSPAFAAYDVLYGKEVEQHIKVKRSDFSIPKSEGKVIAALAQSLHLYKIKYHQGDVKAIQVLQDYMRNNFTYSTWLKAPAEEGKTPLAHFLEDTRSGHCEYFATATTLLLRELGIPARYAVGYSISEWHKDESLYVVRGRDAHAWVEALVGGQWVSIDHTPPNWFEVENQDMKLWQGLKDWFSDLSFMVKKWRYTGDELDTALWYWLLAAMFIFLAFRVLRRVNVSQYIQPKEMLSAQDKLWLELEGMLLQAGYPRKQGATLWQWFVGIDDGKWLPLISLYYVKYYTPHGLNIEQAEQFDFMTQKLRQHLVQGEAKKNAPSEMSS